METRTKDEKQDVVFYTFRMSRKQMRLMAIVFTFTLIAGVALFFLKHF